MEKGPVVPVVLGWGGIVSEGEASTLMGTVLSTRRCTIRQGLNGV